MKIGREYQERFAGRVRSVRLARGLSAQKLADLAGMTRAAISKIECGERHVTLDEAIHLAATLNVPLKDMYSPGPVKARLNVTVD